MVPDEGAQQPDFLIQAPSPSLASEDPVIKDSDPAQPADTTVGGTNAALGDEDIMIDVEGFYIDNPEDGHQEPTAGDVEEEVPTDDATAPTTPPTAREIDD